MVPLGVWMEMGWVATRMLVTGASIVQKWAVLPVSAIAGAPERGKRESQKQRGGRTYRDDRRRVDGRWHKTSRQERRRMKAAGVIVLGGVGDGPMGAIGFPRRQTAGAGGAADGAAPPREPRWPPPPRRIVVLFPPTI